MKKRKSLRVVSLSASSLVVYCLQCNLNVLYLHDSTQCYKQRTTFVQPQFVVRSLRILNSLSDEYNDLSASNSGVVDQLKALSRRLNKLSAEVSRVGNAIDEVEEYSYQFNVKIIGLPEKSSETAAETSALCVKLFQEMGAEVFPSDIDIIHRVPSRQQNGAPKPIICKFVRRLAKASVMETRQSAPQVNPSNIGLSADSVLDRVRIFDHLTPKKQHLLFEAKRFKEQNQSNTASAGPRIPRFIYARVRVPDQ